MKQIELFVFETSDKGLITKLETLVTEYEKKNDVALLQGTMYGLELGDVINGLQGVLQAANEPPSTARVN